MKLKAATACFAAAAIGLLPMLAQAQEVNVSQSIIPDQPYTLIYPATMTLSGLPGEALTLNHPEAPLQCSLKIVTVEDTDWSAQSALSGLDDAEITADWAQTYPGFVLGEKSTTPYQNTTALIYEGTSTGSPMGVPLNIVHTEAVDAGRGYTLDCLFATTVAEQARPIVDFIIANFSTQSDANCCAGDPNRAVTPPA